MPTLLTVGQIQFHSHGEAGYGTFYDPPPPADQLVSTTVYDTVQGTSVIPAAGDVRSGVSVGAGLTGTLEAGGGE